MRCNLPDHNQEREGCDSFRRGYSREDVCGRCIVGEREGEYMDGMRREEG